MKRPLVLFDGDCRFCTMWVERWREHRESHVEYHPLQEAKALGIDIPEEVLQGSLHYIDSNGDVFRGAHAVSHILAEEGMGGRTMLWAYERIPGFAKIAEFFYAFIANNRSVFSWWTRLLFGANIHRPTYALSSWLFFRLLGFVYLVAFGSLRGQMPGLIGSQGILPFSLFFKAVREQIGTRAYEVLPSLLWLSPTDTFLNVLGLAGMACSLLLIFTVAQRFALLACWILYLSLVSAGQIFFRFQWDGLLLEVGFLSFFLAPRGWWQGLRMIKPCLAGRVLLLWLLFRFIFSSGIVKLSSGDPTWWTLTALDYHYFTQPLPTPLAWYVQQLPEIFQKISTVGMFALELLFPFFIFMPGRLRLAGFFGLVGLQILILLTGNYGFFNLLCIALCILLLDDRRLEAFFRLRVKPNSQSYPAPVKWLARMAVCILLILSLVPFLSAFRRPMPFLTPLRNAYATITPFQSMNSYGLFAVMTTERREIEIEGSDDGLDWKTYGFPFKPGALSNPPPFSFLYMPRLDWQMWFAALGDRESNPWVSRLLFRLLQGSPDVLKLFETNPFPEKPPRYIRASVEDYRFSTYAERKESGDWWMARPEGVYFGRSSL
ncbi:MAG: lipase maturation factor family protein [Chthoniobacterales bacterium]